jgi:hypothetical protein
MKIRIRNRIRSRSKSKIHESRASSSFYGVDRHEKAIAAQAGAGRLAGGGAVRGVAVVDGADKRNLPIHGKSNQARNDHGGG